MLKKFGMNESKAISTPMGTNDNLDSDASGNMVDQNLYRSMIRSLLYVTTSRPDVMFSVCKILSLMKRKSFEGIKRILRYLKHTQNVGLWYPKGAKFELNIQTLIMRDARLKERALRALVNYWEDHLFHGHQRSKIVLHYQPPKPNTYRQ